jgi:hypothetical protein
LLEPDEAIRELIGAFDRSSSITSADFTCIPGAIFSTVDCLTIIVFALIAIVAFVNREMLIMIAFSYTQSYLAFDCW